MKIKNLIKLYFKAEKNSISETNITQRFSKNTIIAHQRTIQSNYTTSHYKISTTTHIKQPHTTAVDVATKLENEQRLKPLYSMFAPNPYTYHQLLALSIFDFTLIFVLSINNYCIALTRLLIVFPRRTILLLWILGGGTSITHWRYIYNPLEVHQVLRGVHL